MAIPGYCQQKNRRIPETLKLETSESEPENLDIRDFKKNTKRSDLPDGHKSDKNKSNESEMGKTEIVGSNKEGIVKGNIKEFAVEKTKRSQFLKLQKSDIMVNWFHHKKSLGLQHQAGLWPSLEIPANASASMVEYPPYLA